MKIAEDSWEMICFVNHVLNCSGYFNIKVIKLTKTVMSLVELYNYKSIKLKL